MTRRQAIDWLDQMTRDAHYVDIVVRRNGKDERFQGDWLKEVKALLESWVELDPPRRAREGTA